VLNYVTVYSNTNSPANVNGLEFKDDGGYGLLLIDGDLTLDSDSWWNGLIYVSGTLTFNAPSDPQETVVRGAIFATSINVQKKAVDVGYDVCHIAKAMANQPLKLVRWKTVS
jgi:hypothetical protein